MGGNHLDSLFITGGNGFVAGNLLRQLDPGRFHDVVCISRSEMDPELLARSRARFLRADLADPSSYEKELASADCVIHLAAQTGKAPPREYFRVNVEGTRKLVETCRRLGVPRFLHVSSIAVKFPEKTRYFYAQSKEESEAIVRSSGLRFTIVRPTMILGRGSPVWTGLARLASLPVIPVFGEGRTKIQPIHVEDLVDFLMALVERDRFHGEILELGGPETISIEDFLRRPQERLRGGGSRVAHLPLGLVIPVLTVLEKLIYAALPITVGQLSSFRYDGTIETNSLFEERAAQLKTIDQMIADCTQ